MGIEIRCAKNMREVKRAYVLAAKVFGTSFRKSSQRKAHILKTDNVQSPADVIVAVEGAKIVGMARIMEKKNYFLGSLLRNGGLTSVCVMPEYRGKGLGGGLINAALAKIRQKRFSLSIVIARRAADGFYPQYGYLGTGLFTDLILARDSRDDITRCDRFNFTSCFKNNFLKKYARMHKSCYRHLPLSFYRPIEWWENIRQNTKYKIKNDEFVNVTYKNSLIGYFVYRDNKIIEAACFRKTADIFSRAILRYLDLKLKKSFSEIVIALPMEHICLKYYKTLNNTIKMRKVWNGGHLIRIIDKEKIKKVMLEYVDKHCGEFSKAERCRAGDRIKKKFDNCNSEIHNAAKGLMLGIILNDYNSHIIKKIAERLQHSWLLLDEF